MGELKDDFTKARALCKEWWDQKGHVVDDINTAYRGVSHRQNKQEAEIVDLWKALEEQQARYDALVNRLKEKFSGEQS